jgi:hypothetical protein
MQPAGSCSTLTEGRQNEPAAFLSNSKVTGRRGSTAERTPYPRLRETLSYYEDLPTIFIGKGRNLERVINKHS